MSVSDELGSYELWLSLLVEFPNNGGKSTWSLLVLIYYIAMEKSLQ